MADNKIKAMHKRFGVDPAHRCGECCNLIVKTWQRRYIKCVVYGDSNSTATDWAARNVACGHFGAPFNPSRERTVVSTVVRGAGREKEPLQGQIGFGEMEGVT